jgi:hypothetical protein
MILERGMQNYPSVVMDNFYNNADEIRQYALSQKFFHAENSVHPGKRTKSLFDIDKEFNSFCIGKFLSLFYDLDHTEIKWNAETRFQLIEPYHNDPNHILNKSFIHTDGNCLIAGVVYLNPEPNCDSGTSFYTPNKSLGLIDTNNAIRKIYYNNRTQEEQYIKELEHNHKNFNETVIVKNVYNRIVAYDSNVFHTSTSVHAGNEPRLTQVFFIFDININLRSPLTRVKSYPN